MVADLLRGTLRPKSQLVFTLIELLVVIASVNCQRNLRDDLPGQGRAETIDKDNLKTGQLAFAAYESAASGASVRLPA